MLLAPSPKERGWSEYEIKIFYKGFEREILIGH